jgi:hypothetical protein
MSSLARLRAAATWDPPRWEPNAPWTEADLAAFEQRLKVRFPDDVRAVWLEACGGNLRSTYLWDDELLLGNVFGDYADAAARAGQPIAFGGDNGNLLYYFDPHDRIGRGAWAVFGAENLVTSAGSFFIADSFEAFVERALHEDGWDFYEARRR